MTKYRLIVSPSAKKQIKGLTAHIRDRLSNPQAARAMALEIKNAIASLATMPERIPVVHDESAETSGFRRMVVKNYLVYFQIDEAARRVNVAAVIYGRRDQAEQMKIMTGNE